MEGASDDLVRRLADAVLYEGYMLWPYRRTALKNQQRFTFGGVYPPAWDDRSVAQAQVLLEGGEDAEVDIAVRFLHVVRRQVLDDGGAPVDELESDGERWVSWDEVVERELAPGPISIPAGEETESVAGGAIRRSWRALAGDVSAVWEDRRPGLRRLTLRIANTSRWTGGPRDDALRETFCSTHAVLRVTGGEWASLTDPPEGLSGEAEACQNDGVWPVLVGEEGDRSTLLASPIILSDHPEIAPESPGDLFDSGEIDQMLVLNMLAMTEEERRDMRDADPRARAMLERTEALSEEDRMRLHGRFGEFTAVRERGHRPPEAGGRDERPPWEELERRGPDSVDVGGVAVRAGTAVRLAPRQTGGDIFERALLGRTATVHEVLQDYEGRIQLAVVVADDPGNAFGRERRPGHRFFFDPDEVEPLTPTAGDDEPVPARVLVAGIGNVFLGDDGWGVALAGRLAVRELPRGVDVVDFGIRGMDLAYAMQDGYDTVVFLDATPRGDRPGTLYVIEPDLDDIEMTIDAHGMDPVKVLALARTLGTESLPRTLVVGCEPETRMSADDEDIVADLTEPVRASLDGAVRLVEDLLADLTAPTEGEVPR